MAVKPDEDEPDDKEVKEELIKSLKVTRLMFFAFVPKSSLGQLVVCVNKGDRDEAAEGELTAGPLRVDGRHHHR